MSRIFQHRKFSLLSTYIYIVPAAVIILTFRLLPILYSLIVSFCEWNMGGFQQFVLISNYRNLLIDHSFWNALLNTFYYVIGTVPAVLFLSLFFATLLNKKVRALGLYRTLYYIPVVTSLVAVSMVWKWIYHPRIGIANYVLSWCGIDPLGWLEEPSGIFALAAQSVNVSLPSWAGGPSLALFGIILMGIWKSLGYNIIIFLTGLQNISETFYEAADIDGADSWKKFWHITWALLSPTTFYVLLMTTIVSFQIFGPIYMMTTPPGGPLDSTNVIVHYLYEKGFQGLFRSGDASAIAFVLFAIILTLTLIQKRYTERRVFYT